MNETHKNQNEINLITMLYSGIRKWKQMLIGGCLLAVLLGAYMLISGISVSDDEYANWDNIVQIRDNKFKSTRAKENAELNNLTIEKKIQDQEGYLEQSIYINLDPYNISCAEAEYYISTDYKIMPGMDYQNKDLTDTVAQNYVSLLSNADVLNNVAEQFGTESRYLKEILDIHVSNRILTISVIYDNADMAVSILDSIISYLPSIGDEIMNSISEHTLKLINRTSYSYIGLELIDEQEKQKSVLQTLNQYKTTNDNTIADATYELRELDKQEAVLYRSTNIVRRVIMYAIVGFVVGGILVYAYGCVAYIVSDKVYIANELGVRYGIRIIGRMASGRNKNVIDRSIAKAEGRAYVPVADSDYHVIVGNLIGMKEHTGSIFLTGSTDESVIQGIAEKIASLLDGITIKYGYDIFNNPDSVTMLSSCDSVLLVEECGKSRYSVIEKELDKAEWFGKKVIGCVVVE